MSRFGNTQGVSRPTGVCASTGESLAMNEPAMATLCEREEDEGFDRLDYSIAAWDTGDRPDRLFSYWRYIVPDSNKKQEIGIDDAVLADLFERLADDERPQRIAFRYILALVLLRKRKLKLVGREDAAGGHGVGSGRDPSGRGPNEPPGRRVIGRGHLRRRRRRRQTPPAGHVGPKPFWFGGSHPPGAIGRTNELLARGGPIRRDLSLP